MNKPFLYFFLAFFLLNNFNVAGQTNLVYNGDFELYDTCPSNPSSPGDLQIEHCLGWTAPTKLGTSDYFNVCNNTSTFQLAGVPKNLLGFQQPYNGLGYAGLLAWVVSLTDGSSYREYLQSELIQPLENGNKYHLQFYVSYYGVNYSIEKVGALFTINNLNSVSFSPIVIPPQVVNQNGIISDSITWHKIEGEFIATGGEKFITIGYFEDSLSVFDTLNTHAEPLAFYESYYYIDGVELVDITNVDYVSIPNIITPNNDGINDTFELNFLVDRIRIFNRWGQCIIESSEGKFRWDGRIQSGYEASSGTYYYLIEKSGKQYKGFLQLLR